MNIFTATGRKLSPSPPTNRLAIEAPNEKDEGISDEEDPAELRILLELNEQVINLDYICNKFYKNLFKIIVF